jgi:hypothetical protein
MSEVEKSDEHLVAQFVASGAYPTMRDDPRSVRRRDEWRAFFEGKRAPPTWEGDVPRRDCSNCQRLQYNGGVLTDGLVRSCKGVFGGELPTGAWCANWQALSGVWRALAPTDAMLRDLQPGDVTFVPEPKQTQPQRSTTERQGRTMSTKKENLEQQLNGLRA